MKPGIRIVSESVGTGPEAKRGVTEAEPVGAAVARVARPEAKSGVQEAEPVGEAVVVDHQPAPTASAPCRHEWGGC